MGMTIDDAIRYIKGLRNAGGCGYQQANIAIETMHKYQKIEEIVNTWRHDITAGDYHCMAEIAEVVEDENDIYNK